MNKTLLQGLYDISATRLHRPGELHEDAIGECAWQYAYAGSTALHAGYLGVAVALNAGHVDEAILAAVAIDTASLELTVTAGLAIAENGLLNGDFIVSYGTGVGQRYRIIGNTSITATGTEIIVTLERGIKVALDATSKFTLRRNVCYGVAESTTAAAPVGIAMCDVTANYWYWAQVRGPAAGYTYTTTTAGYMLQQSVNTAGYMDTKADTETGPTVGYLDGTAGINAYLKPIVLTIR